MTDVYDDDSRSLDSLATDSYLTDLQAVWKTADARTRQQLRDGEPPLALIECFRYALIHCTNASSINMFKAPREIMPGDLIRDSLEEHAETLVAKLPQEGTVPAAIEAILAIEGDDYWSFSENLWESVYPYLENKHVEHILASPNEIARARFAYLVICKAPSRLARKALKAISAIRNRDTRRWALHHSLRRTRGKLRAQVLQKLYRNVLCMEAPQWKSHFLAGMICDLKGHQRAEAIRVAIKCIPQDMPDLRCRNAARIMPYLKRGQRTRFLRKMVREPEKMLVSRLHGYLSFWGYLANAVRKEALPLALKIREPQTRAKFLAKIAEKLHSGSAYEATVLHMVEALGEIRNEDIRYAALAEAQEHVHHAALDHAATLPVKRLAPIAEELRGFRSGRAGLDQRYIAYALGNLAAYMSEADNIWAQGTMVDMALEIDMDDYVAEALEEIAPHLKGIYLTEALNGALRIGDELSRVWALSGLLPYLKGEEHDMALSDALECLADAVELKIEPWPVVDMTVRLLPFVDGSIRQRMIENGLAAAALIKEHSYSDTRCRLIPFLAEEEQKALGTLILGDLKKLPYDDGRAETLRSLAPYLPTQATIECANAIADEHARENALSALIPYLPDVQAALAHARKLENPYWRAGALIQLLPKLDSAETLAQHAIESIEMPRYRLGRWVELFAVVEEKTIIWRKAIETMLDFLWDVRNERRVAVLGLCAARAYTSLLPAEVLRGIAAQIKTVCLEWTW